MSYRIIGCSKCMRADLPNIGEDCADATVEMMGILNEDEADAVCRIVRASWIALHGRYAKDRAVAVKYLGLAIEQASPAIAYAARAILQEVVKNECSRVVYDEAGRAISSRLRAGEG